MVTVSSHSEEMIERFGRMISSSQDSETARTLSEIDEPMRRPPLVLNKWERALMPDESITIPSRRST
jgi:hypothetical protein